MDTASQAIVALATGLDLRGRPLQLVTSHELLDTLRRQLLRLTFRPEQVEPYIASLADVCAAGPDGLNPYLVLGGRDQLAMTDREDAGILATALAARANLIVTDNLRDFSTKDSVSIETRTLRRADGSNRRIEAIVHEPPGGTPLLVAHPNDVLLWIRHGVSISPEGIRDFHGIGSRR